jgi:hypothetical protein
MGAGLRDLERAEDCTDPSICLWDGRRRTRRRGRRRRGQVDCSSCHRILDRSSRRRILEQIGRHLHGELIPPPAMEESGVEGVVCGGGGEGRRLLMLEVGLPVAALRCAEPPPLRSGRVGRAHQAGHLEFAGVCRLSRSSRPWQASLRKPTGLGRHSCEAHLRNSGCCRCPWGWISQAGLVGSRAVLRPFTRLESASAGLCVH